MPVASRAPVTVSLVTGGYGDGSRNCGKNGAERGRPYQTSQHPSPRPGHDQAARERGARTALPCPSQHRHDDGQEQADQGQDGAGADHPAAVFHLPVPLGAGLQPQLDIGVAVDGPRRPGRPRPGPAGRRRTRRTGARPGPDPGTTTPPRGPTRSPGRRRCSTRSGGGRPTAGAALCFHPTAHAQGFHSGATSSGTEATILPSRTSTGPPSAGASGPAGADRSEVARVARPRPVSGVLSAVLSGLVSVRVSGVLSGPGGSVQVRARGSLTASGASVCCLGSGVSVLTGSAPFRRPGTRRRRRCRRRWACRWLGWSWWRGSGGRSGRSRRDGARSPP